MHRTHRSLLAIAIVTTIALALVMVGHRNVAQANDDGCNASTVKGAYGFAIGGFVSTTFTGDPQQVGEFVPLAAAGTFSFDGQGTSSRSLTASFGGAVFPIDDSGPYTVNRDCAMSATYSDGTWSMVIIGRGKEIKAMNTAPGTAVQGVLTKQQKFEVPFSNRKEYLIGHSDNVLFGRAMTAVQKAEYVAARTLLETLIKSHPDSDQVPRAKLSVADAEGAFRQAEVEYRDFITFLPDWPQVAQAQLKIDSIHNKAKS